MIQGLKKQLDIIPPDNVIKYAFKYCQKKTPPKSRAPKPVATRKPIVHRLFNRKSLRRFCGMRREFVPQLQGTQGKICWFKIGTEEEMGL